MRVERRLGRPNRERVIVANAIVRHFAARGDQRRKIFAVNRLQRRLRQRVFAVETRLFRRDLRGLGG